MDAYNKFIEFLIKYVSLSAKISHDKLLRVLTFEE